MWTIFLKVFIEFVTLLLLVVFFFFFLILVFLSQGQWDLCSLTTDPACVSCIGRQSLNHWTTKKVL